MIDNFKRVEITVSGRVQRVFFRISAVKEAKKLDLTGWVKNINDGSVKILAEGEEENIKKLIEWSQAGPLLAKVADIEVKWLKGKSEFTDFQILR